MELQNAVKEALDALYHHHEDVVCVQADRWLQDFQRTIDAWQTLLIKFHKGPPKVRTQTGIAVATLAVHVPAEEWGDGGIVNWLGEKMKSHPDYVPGFLELLTVLPEEVFNYKIAARSERRHQFEKELTAQMEIAFNILTSCLRINGLTEQVPETELVKLLVHNIPESMSSEELHKVVPRDFTIEVKEQETNVSEQVLRECSQNSKLSDDNPMEIQNLKQELRDKDICLAEKDQTINDLRR